MNSTMRTTADPKERLKSGGFRGRRPTSATTRLIAMCSPARVTRSLFIGEAPLGGVVSNEAREGNDPSKSSSITYAELLSRVEKFANALKAKGAWPLLLLWQTCED